MATVDFSGLRKLEKQLEQLSKTTVDFGYFSDSVYDTSGNGFRENGYNEGVHVAEIAVIQNYGLGVPKRGFMDNALEDIQKKLGKEYIKEAMISALNNKPKKQYGSSLGQHLKKVIQNTIEYWHTHDHNSPVTIAIKGFDDPLQNSNKLLESVDYRVN